jgi:ABC-type nitrate/sulfonate/bicarbonate transport system substrate-binding protein
MLKITVFEGVQNLPLFAARAKGFFAKHGLDDVGIAFTPNSWVLRDGLADGTYHIAHGAVDNAIAMAELAGKDIAVVTGGDNGFNAIFTQPEIRSYAELRGRTVLVDAVNTAFALVLYQTLRKHGLERGDYEVKSVGATPLRLAAMRSDRSAAAAILNLPFRLLAERAGLRKAGEAVDEIGPYLSTAGFVLRAWGEANRDTLARYIAAYVEGLRWATAPANAAEATALLARELRLAEDVAAEAYAMAAAPQGGLAPDATLDLEGLRNVLRLRAEIENQWGGVAPPPERYLDLSYHRQALAGLRAEDPK